MNSKLSGTDCICKSGFFLDSSNSCQPCNPGFTGNPLTGCYIECHETCQECNQTNCLICKSNNSFPQGLVCNCKDGFYLPANEKVFCEPCGDECSECDSEGLCIKCISDYTKLDDENRCKCKEGYFNETSLVKNNSCIKCKENCLKCKNFDLCQKCEENGFSLTLDGNCFKLCEDGWFSSGGNCSMCEGLCLECLSLNLCLRCKGNSNLYSSKCYCDKGYRLVDSACLLSNFEATLEISKSNVLKLEFDEALEKKLNTSDFLYLKIEDQDTTFSLQYKTKAIYYIYPDYQKYFETSKLVQLELKPSLFSIKNSSLLNYTFSGRLNPIVDEKLKSMISQTRSASQIGSSTAMSFSTISNPSVAWSFLNTIEIISLLPLNSLKYTQKLFYLFSSMLDFNLIPNFFIYLFDPNSTSEPYPNAKKYGIETSVLLLNIGQNLVIMLVYCLFYPFIRLAYSTPAFRETIKKYLVNYKFNFFIRFWIQSYLQIGIYSIIQLKAVLVK